MPLRGASYGYILVYRGPASGGYSNASSLPLPNSWNPSSQKSLPSVLH